MVDVLSWIALVYFINNDNSILFQQIKNGVLVYEVPIVREFVLYNEAYECIFLRKAKFVFKVYVQEAPIYIQNMFGPTVFYSVSNIFQFRTVASLTRLSDTETDTYPYLFLFHLQSTTSAADDVVIDSFVFLNWYFRFPILDTF